MIKRVLLAILAVAALTTQAQTLGGSWKVYSTFSGSCSKVIETPTKIYASFQSSVFVYDKATGSHESYTPSDKLNNSSGISNMYYNKVGGYLAVVYSDCAIDLFMDNGTARNLPQIANYVALSVKAVNSVSFDGTDMLVATTFGALRIDALNGKVVDFKNYKKSIAAIVKLGNKYLANFDTKYWGADAPDEGLLPDLADYVATGSNTACLAMTYISDTKVGIKYTGNGVAVATYNPSTNVVGLTTVSSVSGTTDFVPTADGYSAYNASQLLTVTDAGASTVTTLSGDAASTALTCWNGLAEVWSISDAGFASFNLTSGVAPIMPRTAIDGALKVTAIERMHLGKSGKVYVTTRSQSQVLNNNGEYTSYINTVNPDGSISDLAPTVTTNSRKNTWGMNDWATLPYSVTNICESSVDPNTYYYSTWWSGLYKITNGEMAWNYNWSNSVFSAVANYANDVTAMSFDSHNNLWVTGYFDSGKPVLYCLPADQLNNPPASANWVTFTDSRISQSKDNDLIVSPYTDRIYLIDYNWKGRLAVFETNGTPADKSDDHYVVINTFLDLDGNEIDFNYIYSMAVDHDGVLWLGTSGGILSIPEESLLVGGEPRFNHIKVAATGNYLLDSNATYAIAVDSENNKWFGTNNGLYCTSPDGSVINASYTTSNSPMPSDLVYSLAYIAADNSIMIGTNVGLVKFSATKASGAANFDNVYAYPNTVESSYTGWITIKGLMDQTTVNIVNQEGALCFTGESSGDTLMWNLLDNSGKPVSAGVYSVMVNIEGQPTAVTKIAVVK